MNRLISLWDSIALAFFVSAVLLISGFIALPTTALSQPLTCEGGTLNPSDNRDKDLLITAPCDVKAGEHMYRYVNVITGGVLNFVDEGPKTDFWAKSILVENNGTLKAGTKSDAGAFGTGGGKLTIYLYGKKNDPGVQCESPKQNSAVPCGIEPAIWNSNTKIAPVFPPVAMPACAKNTMPDGQSECFYNYIDPMKPSNTDYFGSKVLAVSYGGTINLYGKKGASYGTLAASDSGKSWARLNMGRVIDATETSLTLDRNVDWDVDDYIVLTTTDYLPGHSEKLKITGKVNPNADGTAKEFNFVVVDPHNPDIEIGGLQHKHNGDTYKLNDVPGRLKLNIQAGGEAAVETRAAVGLLSRSIRVVSGGDTAGKMLGGPTAGNHFGGHTMIRQGAKSAEIQGVEFYQLGQGGIKGRYPVHLHLMRKAPGTMIKDNSIHESMTRFITIHGTHEATIARNVGFMSIGHGFYLEDGTEINNKIQSNLGVLARAAVDNAQNPRKVPGILAATGVNLRDGNIITSFSDYMQPTVFWLTNGWNDVEYNMAAGATACGSCYWYVNAAVSGPSRLQKWESYASIKVDVDRDATAPIKKFRGNYCSTAMNSYNATVSTTPCEGVGIGGTVKINPIPNPLAPAPPGNLIAGPVVVNEFYYPIYSANPNATRCTGTDCSNVPLCSADNSNSCAVTVLDRYTTAFHWTETNFSAIWLRRAFFTVINSAITNVLNAGLTFVTGGDYTQSSLLPGSFMLAANNVFIGNTEEGNPFSSNAGPFSKGGLKCENGISDSNYCLRVDEGISMPLSNFGMNQRLFNIYDGPANQSSNAYLNIKKTQLTDCTPANNGNCSGSEWMYGRVLGVPRDVNEVIGKRGDECEVTDENNVCRKVQDTCILPNAAIAWKQPNGFYYPPAFHSDNLFFDKVDIRHFVIQPLFEPGTFNTDFAAVKENYCVYNSGSFTGWTAIDRQTILNDDDGSLTGVEKTISVNEDPFFTAPIEQFECRSEASAKTSPYEYVTTVIYPGCANKKDCGGTCSMSGTPCATAADCPRPPPGVEAEKCENLDWTSNCTSGCYGVPLVRQFLTGTEDAQSNTEIRMQGPDIFGRINLTANNGSYFIDTTRNQVQKSFNLRNIFTKDNTYYTFFVFAKPEIKQTYQFYVGIDPSIDENNPQIVHAVASNIATKVVKFDEIPGFSTWESTGWDRKYDSSTGILTVTVDMENFKTNFDNAREESCKPSSFCTFEGGKCGCSTKLMEEDPELYAECKRIDICRWSGNDPDCPVFDIGGKKQPRCLGFALTMPSGFLADDMDHRPTPTPFPRAGWDVPWPKVGETLAGKECFAFPVPPSNFGDGGSGSVGTTRNIIEGTEGDDLLIGTMGDDLILGKGGNDTIVGRGGNDVLEGGSGDDVIDGKSGDDLIFGGDGNDDIRGGKGHDNIHAEGGDDTVRGGVGNDKITGGDGNDFLKGQNGNDELDGNSGDDMVEGNRGADEIEGGPGNDVLLGQGGGDHIEGGPGDDMIEGGDGMDEVDGGPGDDTCIQSEINECESS